MRFKITRKVLLFIVLIAISLFLLFAVLLRDLIGDWINDLFGRISSEYAPREPHEIPPRKHGPL